jgi:hypothetical protein
MLPKMNCNHDNRFISNTENYYPVGFIKDICCTQCFKIVGTQYYDNEMKLIHEEGLDCNYIVKPVNKIIFPKFL